MEELINPTDSPCLDEPLEAIIDEDISEISDGDSEEVDSKNEDESTALEISALREKIRELNERLEAQAAESQKISEQLGEFYDVFPNADVRSLPESVWESVRAGNSLAASYALYRQRVYQRTEAAKAVNERNVGNSSGRVGMGTEKEYFSPDEVRSMSRGEKMELKIKKYFI